MRTRALAAIAAAAATLGTSSAPTASADDIDASFGTQLQIVDTDGVGIGGYTVDELRPSSAELPDLPLAGTLWEARASAHAVSGDVVPAMRFFNARTADGRSYRVLVQTFAPDLDISPLSQGGNSDGRIYFDVTGPAPTEVVYDDGRHRAVWTR